MSKFLITVSILMISLVASAQESGKSKSSTKNYEKSHSTYTGPNTCNRAVWIGELVTVGCRWVVQWSLRILANRLEVTSFSS